MKGEIRTGPFIPTVKITEYFTLLSQLSLPPPVAAPRRWKRNDGGMKQTFSTAHSPSFPAPPFPTGEPAALETYGLPPPHPSPSLFAALPPSRYARLQIYAPRLAALISESSRPAPSVMKEINLLFWGCPRD